MTKELKSEKLRIKNDKLLKKGIDPKRKWGKKLINTSIGSTLRLGEVGLNPCLNVKLFEEELRRNKNDSK